MIGEAKRDPIDILIILKTKLLNLNVKYLK